MGIKDLAKVIADYAPNAVSEKTLNSYFGRIVAVDASMSIYQFLIAVRQDGSQLTTDSGETTSHLLGMFYRTIRMIANGIKPIYVFDGKPPVLKADELEKRKERRTDAELKLSEASEAGDADAVNKFNRRLVRVTKEHNDECKKLLHLMGVPYLEAPCEAEAQCAALVMAKKVYASATEDMDTLTFGSDILLRHMTFSEAKKMPIKEFHLENVLKGLELNREQFVDLCILLGCDYCPSIKGIGVKRAVELIQKYKNLDEIVERIDKSKYKIPENWQYKAVRRLFLEPEVADCSDLKLTWKEPDEEGLVEFLTKEKNFSEERVRNGATKLRDARRIRTQTRIDTFFQCNSVSCAAVKRANPSKEKTKSSTNKKTVAKKAKK